MSNLMYIYIYIMFLFFSSYLCNEGFVDDRCRTAPTAGIYDSSRPFSCLGRGCLAGAGACAPVRGGSPSLRRRHADNPAWRVRTRRAQSLSWDCRGGRSAVRWLHRASPLARTETCWPARVSPLCIYGTDGTDIARPSYGCKLIVQI